MIIKAIRIRDFKGVRSVDLTDLGPGLVIITGKNHNGKSSLLDAIEQGLRGGKAICDQPIRNGAPRAEIEFDLGELRVIRTFEQSKAPKLKIVGRDGLPLGGQRALDLLLNSRTLDPTTFLKLKESEQAAELQKALGLDFRAIDARIEAVFADRRDANREAERAAKYADGLPWHSDAPEQEVKASELFAEEAERQKIEAGVDTIERSVTENEAQCTVVDQKIADTRELIAKLQSDLREREGQKARLVEARGELLKRLEKGRELLATKRTPDDIRADIDAIEERNAKYRANQARREAEEAAKTTAAQAKQLTDALEALRAERAAMIANAECPIDGLDISEAGVTLNGIPLSQCSQEENLRVAFEVARLLSPDLRVVCCRDGSNLDDEALDSLRTIAIDNGFQFWLEMVRTSEEDALTIVEGELSNVEVTS